MKHRIAVTTTIFKHMRDVPEPILFWNDSMYWIGVDEEIVDWFGGSCSAAISWYITRPEAKGIEWYTIEYSTIITYEETFGLHPACVPSAKLENLTYEDVCSFQEFAIDQLRELISVFKAHREARGLGATPVKPRSPFMAKLRLLIGALRA